MNWIIWRCQSWIRNSSCPEFSYMIYLNKTNSKRKDTITLKIVAAVQLLSCVWLFVASWDAAHQASLSITISQSLFRFMCIESVMLSNHLIRLPSPSSFALILSQHQGLFQWVGSSHQVAKVLELQLQNQSFQWIFRVDFLFFFSFFFLFFFFNCSGFSHTLKWISHGFTCVPHPDPPSHLPLHPIPLGLPSAPGPSPCLMHPAWAGDLLHPR